MSELSNLSRVEKLLADPSPEQTLEELARQLNELATLRQSTRVAFCKKIARVYFLIVGSKPMLPGSTGHRGYDEETLAKRKQFFLWCRHNLRSGTGKEYTTTTLETYVGIGFKEGSAKFIQKQIADAQKRASTQRSIAAALMRALPAEGPKVIPIRTLQRKYEFSGDVASEVNALMRAWEQASEEARRQFLSLVTNRRVG